MGPPDSYYRSQASHTTTQQFSLSTTWAVQSTGMWHEFPPSQRMPIPTDHWPQPRIKPVSQYTLERTTLVHKLGCKCRKTKCLKKYCECFNAGVKCGESCQCIDCENRDISPNQEEACTDDRKLPALKDDTNI